MKNLILLHVIRMTKLFTYAFLIQFLSMSFLFAWNGNAQIKDIEEVMITLTLEDTKIEKAFSTIEKMTGFSFVYTDRELKGTPRVTTAGGTQTVYDLLSLIGRQTGLYFKQVNRNIHVRKVPQQAKELERVANVEALLEINITGRVTDENGEPLPGASITVSGTTSGTVTDIDGYYSITVPENATLVFSYIGYESKSIVVGMQNTINVTLGEDQSSLEEVVVTGYGTQERAKVTSAISEVNTSELKSLPLSQPGQLLQGRASGITVRDNNGAPGSTPSIQVRGLSSINAGVSPLVVIDGNPVGDIPSSLSANDIEKITVLKDAASTSIYGARGSNGVVLIETVRAKEAQSQVEYTVSGGYNYLPQNWRPTFLNAQQYAQYNVERIQELNARNNTSNPVPQIYLDVLADPNYGPGTNWQDEVFQEGSDARFQSHNLTYRGGSEKLRGAVSAGYLDQDGLLPNTNFKRYSLRTNVDGKFNDWLSAGANLSVSHTESNETPELGPRGISMTAMTLSPLKSPYDENGELVPYIDGDSPGYFSFANPLFKSKVTKDQTISRDIYAGMNLDIKIIEGLHFRPRVYSRLLTTTNNVFIPTTVGRPAIGNGGRPPLTNSATNVNFNITNWGFDNLLSYDRRIGMHSFGTLLGYTSQKQSGEMSSINASNFPNDNNINFLEASQVSAAVTDRSNWALAAFFGRLNYDFNGKYLAEVNFRREGSSRFGAKNKYGNFPSASIGWRVSEESFYPKDFFINELKIRSSYGITGNSAIGDFDQYGQILSIPNLNNLNNNYNYVLNSAIVTGKALASLGSENLKWETSKQFDIGLSLGFFEDQFGLKVDYYEKTTEDMLFNVSVPQASGFSSSRINVGEMQNKGWDFEAVGSHQINDFMWNGNLNVSLLRNIVTSMPEQIERIIIGDNITEEGIPVGSLYGYQIDGIFNTREQLDDPDLYGYPGAKDFGGYIYRDVNNDGIINAQDKTNIGNPHPRTVLGFNNQFSYKNLSLSILMTGSFGYQIANALYEASYNEVGRWNVDEAFLTRWKSPENPGAGRIPAIYYPGQHFVSNVYVENGDHLWIKNITLGYQLPAALIDRTEFISNVRFTLSAQNLFKFTEYTGYNPEVSQNGGNPSRIGVDDFSYPVPRTITLGASITL
ncbi:TonB-dependent receptor [Cyclobacterium sp.]|uniref:SusC/RagA family TonB-linked outer membrane protein n=1 Tax=Cyclobacterium sp. TaxID=1966343 RepID=UPI00199E56D3|nr:TonB-dependent receptor [Cyclobacterium sp.]MBD3629990.1 TonB-dependent receptor [Cyclobacterium sp.]